mmetsp:Transcript_26560/g.41198  ORF Transcript_26560/g.41198 Transcript_26560/m.41198 type:complete len:216 (-) Transcript_26560:4275-4922(-)
MMFLFVLLLHAPVTAAFSTTTHRQQQSIIGFQVSRRDEKFQKPSAIKLSKQSEGEEESANSFQSIFYSSSKYPITRSHDGMKVDYEHGWKNVISALTIAAFVFMTSASASNADVGDIFSAAARNSEISYSSNAKNLNRLSTGDASGGSVYNNSPSSTAAAKRRALTGCKSDLARREAGIGERECNLRVFDGDTDFMLEILRKLDCPTCPYGIGQP